MLWEKVVRVSRKSGFDFVFFYRESGVSFRSVVEESWSGRRKSKLGNGFCLYMYGIYNYFVEGSCSCRSKY